MWGRGLAGGGGECSCGVAVTGRGNAGSGSRRVVGRGGVGGLQALLQSCLMVIVLFAGGLLPACRRRSSLRVGPGRCTEGQRRDMCSPVFGSGRGGGGEAVFLTVFAALVFWPRRGAGRWLRGQQRRKSLPASS